MTRIAIVGLACLYPDAHTVEDYWTNIVAGRRAFRRLPEERMPLADYWSADPTAPDRFYARHAAVIRDYEFDRVGFRVAGSTYRATDLTHWVALDKAAEALADAGFPNGDGLPRQRTGVVLGNTLTGEFARANLLRLRWPYVRRVFAAALSAQGWRDGQVVDFLNQVEGEYKRPFPAVDEDTLAGGLSNTIAGRICNYFDLGGGGYTVDAACASSLLSVALACRSLRDHELDVAIVGGVDISIDPFETVGFAKTGALARTEMRVYDRDSNGFWPGEGCGMVVLMRESDVPATGRSAYATIAGCGVSSDGKGGITRPELSGYQLALRRAYQQAGFGFGTVSLVEGHGTGTAVGDEVELTALSAARRAADAAAPAAIGSVKAMIGHTKAAAGIAGLIKATLAVHHETLPPTVGCIDPHPVLRGERSTLRTVDRAEAWPLTAPVRAGVSAMGFGGINTHVVLEQPNPRRRAWLDSGTAALSRLALGDGAELLVVDAEDPDQLRRRLEGLAEFAARLSYAELGDLAAMLGRQVAMHPWRAAVVARSPEQAEAGLRRLAQEVPQLAATGRVMSPLPGAFLGHAVAGARVGLLFPGQGSAGEPGAGALWHRFAEAEQIARAAKLPTGGDPTATELMQPRLAAAALAGQRVLASFGIEARLAVGHSLGELCAIHWAGGIAADALSRIVAGRARIMASCGESGVMASIAAPAAEVGPLLDGSDAVIAAYNAPDQTVVAGPAESVALVGSRAEAAGYRWSRLAVSHAFHSPRMVPAVGEFGRFLAAEQFGELTRPMISTVTGGWLPRRTELAALLRRQLTAPVQFSQAMAAAAAEVDLFVEVGPGSVLSRLASANSAVPAFSIDTDAPSLAPLWRAVGAAFVTGVPVTFDPLWAGRPARHLDPDAPLRFFQNPCEDDSIPIERSPGQGTVAETGESPSPSAAGAEALASALTTVRTLVAERAELPREAVTEESRLLDDLHLSSITAAQVYVQAAHQLGAAATAPAGFATATVRELAAALIDAGGAPAGQGSGDGPAVRGVADWVHPFRSDWVRRELPDRGPAEPAGGWQLFAAGDHPLAESIRQRLVTADVGAGVLLCLSPGCPESELELARLAAQAALRQPAGGRFVVVQHGRGVSALAKTARLEGKQLRTTVVDTPLLPAAVERVYAEVAATRGYSEVRYHPDGERLTPVLRPVRPSLAGSPLSNEDVLLVTGGGRGITAECALALAAESGVRLAILGRSDPTTDAELAANLARLRGAGVTVDYHRADLTDPTQVRDAVHAVREALGPVTAVLHGAGGNAPAGLAALTAADFAETLTPKLSGLTNLLAVLDQPALKVVVTFGSAIGRTGLAGEAHYALANEWLAHATTELADRLPECRVHCVEWSVWTGVGMGARLGAVDSLAGQGITPIPVAAGTAVLRELIADPATPSVVTVSGRLGGADTVEFEAAPPPLLRFVDRLLVNYPEVELVVETRLDRHRDRYLADHQLDGAALVPAVFAIEAMSQVAAAMTGRSEPPAAIEQVEFLLPLLVPAEDSLTVRIAALARTPEVVEVVIRGQSTGFREDHCRAVIRYGPVEAATRRRSAPATVSEVPLAPAQELYGGVLFQGGRFQRLQRYWQVASRSVVADVATGEDDWFAEYLPSTRLLGDPGARDAVLHGLQVCVPRSRLLPVAVDRLRLLATELPSGTELRVAARERHQQGDLYVYDVEVWTTAGQLVEVWEGLRLRAVAELPLGRPWPVALCGPLLQRRLAELTGRQVTTVVEPEAGGARRAVLATAVRRVLTLGAEQRDRREQPAGVGNFLATAPADVSPGGTVTLAAFDTRPLGAAVQAVTPRSEQAWAALLGGGARLIKPVGETDSAAAATRVWCAALALRQLAAEVDWSAVEVVRHDDGWVVFEARLARVATALVTLAGNPQPVVFAIACG